MSIADDASRKVDNLYGTIRLATPISWQVVTAVIGTAVAAVTAFLLAASYDRTEIARGAVAPEGGILRIVPPRAGWVETVLVREGNVVRGGTVLVRVRSEEVDQSGAPKRDAILAALDAQAASLRDQVASKRAAAAEEQARFDAQISGIKAEIKNLDARIKLQGRLIEIARSDIDKVRQIASRGFISQRDVSAREETFLERQQQFWSLQETRETKRSTLQQLEHASRMTRAEAEAASASLEAVRAQARKEEASTRANQGYALVAPASGRVTAVSVHPGDAVSPAEPVMLIVPTGGSFVARLDIPAKAAGFIRPGQDVRLTFDAYPNDRFGSVNAKIRTISSAPVLRSSAGGASIPVYAATAILSAPFIEAYGKREPLLPGMTFTAHVVTHRQTIGEWLFDPLDAAGRI